MKPEIALYYEITGAGFPLVLLHGNNEDHTYFAEQVKVFSAHYQVIAVDTRGHGKSPRGTAPFTLHQFAVDLYGLLQKLGVAKMHLLGFSDGANIAILFTLQYPQMVEKLILNGANLRPSAVKASVQIPIVCCYVLASIGAKFSKKARSRSEMLGLMVNEPQLEYADLSALTMPTLVLVGNRDMIKAKHSHGIAAALPQGKYCEIAGSHFAATENPAEYNQQIMRFLAEME